MTKRSLDVLFSLAALAALAPVLLALALLIKATSPGPALFRQARLGYLGRPFTIYKFRTMFTDRQDLSGVRQTVNGDSRITPVGRFLRRTSLDELPQLLNVLLGEMSLVGPRPHVPGMLGGGMPYESLVPYYNKRLLMPPGVTGWAQVNGLRGPTTESNLARARVDHDVAYVQNFSLKLDLYILWRTAVVEVWRLSGH